MLCRIFVRIFVSKFVAMCRCALKVRLNARRVLQFIFVAFNQFYVTILLCKTLLTFYLAHRKRHSCSYFVYGSFLGLFTINHQGEKVFHKKFIPPPPPNLLAISQV